MAERNYNYIWSETKHTGTKGPRGQEKTDGAYPSLKGKDVALEFKGNSCTIWIKGGSGLNTTKVESAQTGLDGKYYIETQNTIYVFEKKGEC